VDIESLYRACCHLVPFGRSGSRGSNHSALRGLVYVPRGRCCPHRAGHCRCNCDGAVIAHEEPPPNLNQYQSGYRQSSVGRTPRRPVVAQDIRDLQRWTGHARGRLRRRWVFPMLAEKRGLNRRPLLDVDAVADQCASFFCTVVKGGAAAWSRGAVAGVVGIEVGVVSGVFNLESSGVDAPDWRPRHEEH
jgi:hypothetical protein